MSISITRVINIREMLMSFLTEFHKITAFKKLKSHFATDHLQLILHEIFSAPFSTNYGYVSYGLWTVTHTGLNVQQIT